MAMIFNGAIGYSTDMTTIPQDALRNIRAATQERGLVSREEAEALFTMDRYGFIGGDDWLCFAVKAVTHFVVWDSRPTGHVTEQDADWLIGLVGDKPTAFGRAVLFALVREAESVPPRISELVMRAAVGRSLLI
ncbi:MAG: hypothetical protein ACKVON_10850 [Beijerinckiaceae bacterium]